MSTSESYDTTKLLTNLNITNWDHHLREKLSAYPIMGKAIRKGIRYEVIEPTVHDLFEDGARMYSYLPHSTNLDKESRKDFLSACTDFKKTEARRSDEEAKICALITSSFSEEAKMLLRSNKTYVLAADDNDSFAMYTIAKAAHTRVTCFAVAQHAFENLFKITMTGTFAAYSDALSNARLTFDAIFDPTTTGTMPIDNIFTMMIVNGLPERFRYMKDRLYSQDLNGAFPTYDEVHLAMQTYDLNNRSIETLSATPSGPTILAATTDVQPICTICRKPFIEGDEMLLSDYPAKTLRLKGKVGVYAAASSEDHISKASYSESSQIKVAETLLDVDNVVIDKANSDDFIVPLKSTATYKMTQLLGSALYHVQVQYYELIRKRFIIASRDLKGIFFQVVFPAIQILCILLILTINVNPAGHTLTLNSKLFKKEAYITPTVVVADGPPSLGINITEAVNSIGLQLGSLNLSALRALNVSFPGLDALLNEINLNAGGDVNSLNENIRDIDPSPSEFFGANNNILSENDILTAEFTSSIYRSGLSDEYMNIINSTAWNSTSLSRSLLSPESYVDDRFGAFIFNDVIPWNVTVNWAWVRANKEILGSGLIAALETAGAISIRKSSEEKLVIDTIWNMLPNNTQFYNLPLPSQFTVMHNSTSPHAIAAFYTEFTQTAFKQCQKSKKAHDDHHDHVEYLVKNHPLPITPTDTIEIEVILALLTSIFIIVPLCYIPASFVSFLVKERVSKSKHLQIVSSVSPYLYWIATYTWDMFLFSFLVAFIIGTFFIFGNASKVFINSAQSTGALILLLMLYGMSCIPLSYLYSMLFENFSTAQISIMVINFLTGFVFVLAYYVLINVPKTRNLGLALVHFFRIFPPYLIGEGLINLSTTYYVNKLQGGSLGYFDWTVTGRNLVYLSVEAVGFFAAVLLTEFPLLGKLLYAIDRYRLSKTITPSIIMMSAVDQDVLKEQAKVETLFTSLYGHQSSSVVEPVVVDEVVDDNEDEADVPSIGLFETFDDNMNANICLDDDRNVKRKLGAEELKNEDADANDEFAEKACVLLIKDLVKTYPPSVLGGQPKYAVRGMSLACSAGERFGLLGINGAGKTTTLSVLTGDIQLSTGEVYIGGKSLSDPSTMTMIGYCPQVDPLLELMNGYETLWFFGRIRNIPPDVLRVRVDALIKQVGLEPFAHKVCGSYSGGNKRKLSLAVALIGDPSVLLLDEPSTGMDPEARRNMWTVIEQVSAERSVVLVSHSMEEVEALCTRVGVMVSGRMKCLGSVQHLKSRFGMGYQIEIRCLAARAQDCISLCENIFPCSCTVDEVHGGFIRLKVSNDIDLGHAFQALEESKASYNIYDYSISQCTLEQVFIQFAKAQEEETTKVPGLFSSSIQPSPDVLVHLALV